MKRSTDKSDDMQAHTVVEFETEKKVSLVQEIVRFCFFACGDVSSLTIWHKSANIPSIL